MQYIIQFLISNKVVLNIRKLYPKWETGKRISEYYENKIKYSALILIAGTILFIFARYSSDKDRINENTVIRNSYGDGTKTVKMTVTDINGDISKDIEVKISEKKYSDEEVDELYDDFIKKFSEEIKADNQDLDHVSTNLNFVNRLDGYPFTVNYKTDTPLVLSDKGIINEERLEKELDDSESESIIIKIIAEIRYADYSFEEIFFTRVFRRELTKEEAFEKAVNDALIKEDEKSAESDYFTLPETVNGTEVSFIKAESKDELVILIITLILAAAVFILKDKDLEKEVKVREEELLYSYPAFINKFTLFYGAGMPVKNIWIKLCNDYLEEKKTNGKKKYLYEEMLVTKKQMLDGKREVDAYEEFASRIEIQKYRVFVSLLEQAVIVGKKDLISKFKSECENTYLERKNNAKRKFEEAGTKLLIPMFMMLMVVMVIIMFPAMFSFKM